MKRWLGLGLASAVIAVSMIGARAGRTYGQQRGQGGPPNFQAQQAAENWLALVDQGRYGESYDQAAQSFKVVVGREEWIHDVTKARAPLGKLISRKVAKSEEMRNPPNAPPGVYVAIVYQSSFTNLSTALETVVPQLEKDGKWRVSGYYVKKAQ